MSYKQNNPVGEKRDEMSYKQNNPVGEKRDKMLLERSNVDPQIKALLVESSEKELIPTAQSWINRRQKLKDHYNSLSDSNKENMIANVIQNWRIPTSTKKQTNNLRLFGGKRKTKKQRKHRKAGKSKKQRKTKTKTKTKTRKHRKAGNSKKY